MKRVILVTVILSLGFLAQSHEFWIQPSKFRFTIGEELKADFKVGETGGRVACGEMGGETGEVSHQTGHGRGGVIILGIKEVIGDILEDLDEPAALAADPSQGKARSGRRGVRGAAEHAGQRHGIHGEEAVELGVRGVATPAPRAQGVGHEVFP